MCNTYITQTVVAGISPDDEDVLARPELSLNMKPNGTWVTLASRSPRAFSLRCLLLLLSIVAARRQVVHTCHSLFNKSDTDGESRTTSKSSANPSIGEYN